MSTPTKDSNNNSVKKLLVALILLLLLLIALVVGFVVVPSLRAGAKAFLMPTLNPATCPA